MTAVQETKIPGNPADIEAVAVFMRNAVSRGADTWSADIGSAKTKMLDGWSGEGADAFGTVITKANTSITSFGQKAGDVSSAVYTLADALKQAQQSMDGVLRTASAGRLTVTGTQVHQPQAPVQPTPTPMPSGEEPRDNDALADEYANQVQTWNAVVTDAKKANDAWQSALERFAEIWRTSGANMITLLSGLLTAGVTGAALGNAAFRLKSTKLVNGQRFDSLLKSIESAGKGGKINVSASSFYKMLDDAADAGRAVASAEKVLAGSADDLMGTLKAGSKLSRGLLVLGVLGTGYGIYDDIANGGESVPQAVVSNVGGMAAGMGAAFVTGLGVGAAVGSFIAPPAGTIAGAVVGAVVGGVVGVFSSGVIDHLFEGAADGIGGAIEAGWTEVTDTVGAIGDGVAAVGEGIADAASGVWHSIFG